MDAINDSGHYAIAGFLFQLIGTGVEAIEVFTSFEGDEEPDQVLVLERFGQDAAVLPVDGNTKPRLIQYKFSSKGETIKPSELREILQAMLNSVRSEGLGVDQVAYELVTNRDYSRDTKKWRAAQSESELAELIKNSSQSDVADAAELAAIFHAWDYKPRTEAQFRCAVVEAGAQFGVLESEIDDRIDGLVGLLLFKAGEPGRRIVRRSEILRKLSGFDNPYKLLSKESIKIRQDDVADYKHEQTDGKETILRSVSGEIAKAVLEHPVVVVVGDGGSGKSVAVADAVTSGLQVAIEPPGFGTVRPALRVNAETLMQSVARWRNLLQHNDGHNLDRAPSRLRVAFPQNPFLVICVEAIDENDGPARLPTESRGFIRSMIDRAIQQHEEYGMPVTSVVLTCRRPEDLDELAMFEFTWNYHRIDVADFNAEEMEKLAARIVDEGVRRRLTHHLQVRTSIAGRITPTATRPVSADAMLIVTHPMIWRCFSDLEVSAQHAVLDGSRPGFDQLASLYLTKFRKKAESRNSFDKHECHSALVAVAQRFEGNTTRIADRASDWVTPCTNSGSSPKNANQLFSEAMTAGVLVSQEAAGKRWRWRHGWFCDYLSRQ